jgi:hypothetical protein
MGAHPTGAAGRARPAQRGLALSARASATSAAAAAEGSPGVDAPEMRPSTASPSTRGAVASARRRRSATSGARSREMPGSRTPKASGPEAGHHVVVAQRAAQRLRPGAQQRVAQPPGARVERGRHAQPHHERGGGRAGRDERLVPRGAGGGTGQLVAARALAQGAQSGVEALAHHGGVQDALRGLGQAVAEVAAEAGEAARPVEAVGHEQGAEVAHRQQRPARQPDAGQRPGQGLVGSVLHDAAGAVGGQLGHGEHQVLGGGLPHAGQAPARDDLARRADPADHEPGVQGAGRKLGEPAKRAPHGHRLERHDGAHGVHDLEVVGHPLAGRHAVDLQGGAEGDVAQPRGDRPGAQEPAEHDDAVRIDRNDRRAPRPVRPDDAVRDVPAADLHLAGDQRGQQDGLRVGVDVDDAGPGLAAPGAPEHAEARPVDAAQHEQVPRAGLRGEVGEVRVDELHAPGGRRAPGGLEPVASAP